MKVHPVEPIGTHHGIGCFAADDGERLKCRLVEIPSYPPSPRGEELREARMAARMTMGQAARAAGVSVSEWCGIERGAHVPEDWSEAFAIVGVEVSP